MIVYGLVTDYRYTEDGGLLIQVRIPNIHGARNREAYGGNKIRNFVEDKDLPYYPSLLLKDVPAIDQTVALVSADEGNNSFLVLGPVSSSYIWTV